MQLAAELLAIDAVLGERQRMRESVRSQLFDRQLALRDDPAQFRAAHPGRRAGKSEFIPRAALLDALDAGFEEYIVIGAETQKKAKALHWHKLERAAKRAGIPLVANKQEGTFRTPWGAVILFWGISDEGAVDLLRGFSVKAAYFDEVATYASLLKYLCEDVMHPALSTTGGKLTLCGTPSLTRAGYWFEICKGKEKQNWSVHHWTMLQNKCFPRDAEEELAKAAARLGGVDNATYQREWLGEFVDDPGMQVYKYLASRNDVQCELPPGYNRDEWAHTVAVDFGMTDACAWMALASPPHSKTTWVLRARKQVGLLTDQAAQVTAEWCEQYRPERLVGDAGGLGKPYVEEWNQRFAGLTKDGKKSRSHEDYVMPVMWPAEKKEKRAGIEFVNSELVAGRILFCQPACADATEELQSLPWADETKQKEHAGYQNHCTDTLLYGEKAHMAYLNEAPRVEESKSTLHLRPDELEYIEREREELRRGLREPESDYARPVEREWWNQ